MKKAIKNIIRKRVVNGKIDGITRIMINIMAIYEKHTSDNIIFNLKGIARVAFGR